MDAKVTRAPQEYALFTPSTICLFVERRINGKDDRLDQAIDLAVDMLVSADKDPEAFDKQSVSRLAQATKERWGRERPGTQRPTPNDDAHRLDIQRNRGEAANIRFPNSGLSLHQLQIGGKLATREDYVIRYQRLLGAVLRANRVISSWDVFNGDFRITASPNWYAGAAQDSRPVGTGGPGGHDEPTTATKTPLFSLPSTLMAATLTNAIDVYILDSAAPKLAAQGPLQIPLENGRVAELAFVSDPTIDAALNDISSEHYLPIYPPPSSSAQPPILPPHGVFVASLITSVVGSITNASTPNLGKYLRLHLIPVLNECCIGTLASFAAGLVKVAHMRGQNRAPFVLNMSLVFAEPVYTFLDALFRAMISFETYADEVANLTHILQVLVSSATAFAAGQPAAFVASAGNKNGLVSTVATPQQLWAYLAQGIPLGAVTDFPPPAFPASSDEVYGIGALDSTLNAPAKYSFLADIGHNPDPLPGIWVTGGDLPKSGLIGQVGVGKCVSWEGTSFAAGVASGVEALCLIGNLRNAFGRFLTIRDFCTAIYDPNDPALRIGWALKEVVQYPPPSRTK